MIDVMVDVETLGIEDNARVIQISAGAFKIDHPVREFGDFVETFDSVLDFKEELRRDRVTANDIHDVVLPVELGTLQFWTSSSENAETFNKLLNSNTGTTEYSMVRSFHTFLRNLEKEYGEVLLWGNGIIFDNVKLEKLFDKYGLESPIKFYNHRDVRTILELASIKTDNEEMEYKQQFSNGIEKHNALHDVLFQARYVTQAFEDLCR